MKDPDIIKISFSGDLMCLKEQNEAVSALYGSDLEKGYDEIFRFVKPLFEDTDFLIGNLETPICESSLSSEAIRFNTPKEYIKAIVDCGFNFVSTANNHCLDRGIEGLNETITNLDEAGIAHSGTYLTKEDSDRIFVTEVSGIRIAIICATFGTNSEFNGEILPSDETWRVDLLKRQNKPARVRFNTDSSSGKKMIADNVTSAAISNSSNKLYMDRYLEKISRAHELADLIFILPHTGGQYNPYPGSYTRYITEATSKLKPSYIVCNHPHVPHFIAELNGVPVAYSLGNFSFTPEVGYYLPNSLAEYGIVVHTYWDKRTLNLRKNSFSIIKNMVCEDGISRVYPVSSLMESIQSPIEKERLEVEVQAVANRVASTYGTDIFKQELDLISLPN